MQRKSPAPRQPPAKTQKGPEEFRDTLYRNRWKVHEPCPHNHPGSDCYIANQTECNQFRILHEPQARCPGDPSRWGNEA